MRRATILRLIGVILVVGIGAYTAFWWIAAGKIKEAAVTWRDAVHSQNIDASWQDMHVTGFPLAFRLDLGTVAVKDGALNPPAELEAPTLIASVRPWNFQAASFAAPDGISATFGAGPAPIARISAERGSGAAARGDDGGATVWLSLYQATADIGVPFAARAVHAWLALPPGAPQDGLGLAIDMHEATPPMIPPGFNGAIDDLAFGVRLQGDFPAGPLRQAAAMWRDSGGTLELDHLDLRWGEMQIDGSGTLALDNQLQPVGGFSGGISGFDQLLSALVAAGRVKASDARVARLALAMLAKAGPDGRPEIGTSLTIQNGQMYLGPAKLGPAPRIDW